MPERRVDWYPFDTGEVSTALQVAEATIADEQIRYAVEGQAFESGRAEGLRVDLWCYPNWAVSNCPPVWNVLLLPSGMTVPPQDSLGALQQHRRFHWARKVASQLPSAAGTVTWAYQDELVIGTRRRFDSGDRLVITLANMSASMFGAGAKARAAGELYVRQVA